ncbi:hypothetical protein NE237_025018 [Protea cynaroides]|uniref:RING-type E3 ubiquitin transferase n=1 Tax=Protea cynaroides TaxID=273540 RepID=A0A9Q0H153_9MAGN|nr:hypothetical protein NE237_025018 [Protea cynaroides]
MRRRLDLLPQPPPPPLFGEIGGGIPETTNDGGSSSSSESSKGNLNPSVIIISLILMAVLLFSILLHLLLRYLSGSSSSASSDHHLPSTDHAPRISSRRVSPEYHQSLIDSLPLFSLNSVIRLKNSSPVDCAVCLSKLEPHDQLRLLPLCCHAFHARCIDTWLASNPTCPLCRSTIRVDESEEMAKLSSGGDSFRLEIGSVSRGSTSAAAVDSGGIPNSRRSYSMGSYEYVVEEDSEVVVVGSMQQQGASGNNHGQKDINCETSPGPANVAVPEPPGAQVAAEVGGGGGGGGRG